MPSVSGVLGRVFPSNRFDSIPGAIYDYGIEHERLGRIFGWLMWSADTRPMYESMACVADAQDGSTILDVPCGGGVVFRHLSPDQDVRYLAADVSTDMLGRARGEAERLGLEQIEFVETDVGNLPFADQGIDICLSYNGLHCFPDPAEALREIGRCLRPGGRLVGSTVLRGQGLREGLMTKLFQQMGTFGPGNTLEQLETGAEEAGLKDLSVELSGALALFEAYK